MSFSDDVPARPRGAVRPPPSQAPDDAPDAVEVPRMDPPPPSLEAMVNQPPRLRRPKPKPKSRPRWLWLCVALATAAVTAYLLR